MGPVNFLLLSALIGASALSPLERLSPALLQSVSPQGVVAPEEARDGARPVTESRQAYWSQKNGDSRRSGASSFSVGQISKLAWTYEARKGEQALYNTPVIDSEGNVYSDSTSGRLFSLSKDGTERWERQIGTFGPQISTPVLLGDALYLSNGLGLIFCINLDGSIRWINRYCTGNSGSDAWSAAGSGSTILLLGNNYSDSETFGSGRIIHALSAVDGHVLWRHDLPFPGFNAMPAIVGDAVIVADLVGGILSLGLHDGVRRWTEGPSGTGMSFTTGGMAVGPNDLAYVTSNINTGCELGDMGLMGSSNPSNCGNGMIRAHSLKDGQVVWKREFVDFPANNAPVVYTPPGGDLTVLIGIGVNPPSVFKNDTIDAAKTPTRPHRVVAMNAATGDVKWTFDTPIWRSNAAAGSFNGGQVCWPDAFSNAAVDADGKVYIGWLGGVLFILDGSSGKLLSKFDIGTSIQGEPALMPGMVLVQGCQRLAAFSR